MSVCFCAHLSAVAAAGARTPTNAYLNVLAKLTFVETARSEHRKKMDMEEILRRQRGEHGHWRRCHRRSIHSRSAAQLRCGLAPRGRTRLIFLRVSCFFFFFLSLSLPHSLFLFLSPATPSSPAPGSPAPPVSTLPLAQSRADSDAAFRSQMERAITRRAHHKQSWFSSLSSVLDLDDAEAACVALFHVCSVTKKQLNQERSDRVETQQGWGGNGWASFFFSCF